MLRHESFRISPNFWGQKLTNIYHFIPKFPFFMHFFVFFPVFPNFWLIFTLIPDYSTTRDIWHFRPTPSNSPLSFTCTLSRSFWHITTLIRQLGSSEICLQFLAIFSQIISISIIRKIVRNPDPRHIQINFYFLIRHFDPCSTVGNRNKST